MKKLLIISLLFLIGCSFAPERKLTPFERCKENAEKLGIYSFSYAKEENDGVYSCVIPLENDPQIQAEIEKQNEEAWQRHLEFLRYLDTHDIK
jgi:hypothetical protein